MVVMVMSASWQREGTETKAKWHPDNKILTRMDWLLEKKRRKRLYIKLFFFFLSKSLPLMNFSYFKLIEQEKLGGEKKKKKEKSTEISECWKISRWDRVKKNVGRWKRRKEKLKVNSKESEREREKAGRKLKRLIKLPKNRGKYTPTWRTNQKARKHWIGLFRWLIWDEFNFRVENN